MPTNPPTVALRLTHAELSELGTIEQLSPGLREKVSTAQVLLKHKVVGRLAVQLLTPYQQGALAAAVDLIRTDQLPDSRTAREAALWIHRSPRAIILCLLDEGAASPLQGCDYGLELIPPSQPASLRPEDDGFDSLNLGWFRTEQEARDEAAKLGLAVAEVEC